MATFDITGTNKNKLYHYKVCGFSVNYHTSVQTQIDRTVGISSNLFPGTDQIPLYSIICVQS